MELGISTTLAYLVILVMKLRWCRSSEIGMRRRKVKTLG